MGNKRTLLVAHCDDEFLFLFPFIKNVDKIVCVTSDINNPDRAWCKRRKEGFFEIAEMVGIKEAVCLDYSSRFYSLPNKQLFSVVEHVRGYLEDADVIATHNAWGEYGHLDHVLCHQMARMTGKEVLTTDILLQADWYPVSAYQQSEELFEKVQNDMDFHNRCMAIYRKYAAMGWTYEPVKEATIVKVQ